MGGLPSVTRVLAPWTDFSRVPTDTLAAAADRGTRVHRACTAIVQGCWPLTANDVLPYVSSFEQWVKNVADVILTETELIDPSYGFMGHPDLICRLKDGNVWLIDLKTPAAVAKSWRVQLAAYRRLAEVNGHRIDRTATLRLSKDGKHPILDETTATNASDLAVFLNCLSAFKYFKEAP